MFSKNHYDQIKNKYGQFASWAIWHTKDESDTNIIDQNIHKLHSNWILIGLNISKPITNLMWGNFRGGKHDRKLKIAFNNTDISGAYMTDLIKYEEKNSTEIDILIKNEQLNVSEHIKYFVEELKFVGINEKTKFIIFGGKTRELYDKYYEIKFPNNKVYYVKHYSGRGTDKEWVEYIWKRLNINLNFEEEYEKYNI